MSEKCRRPKRGQEILRLVRDHGPVAIEMLSMMLDSSMSKKNLRKALRILREKKLIEAVQANSQTIYYQISQSLKSRSDASALLNCTPAEIVRPLLRKQDFFHNQWCEYWSLSLKRLYPEVQIVREHTVGSHELAKRVLQLKDGEYDLLPDFLAIFPKEHGRDATFIAFEVERTRKSNKRLLHKLQRYLNGTKIDGLIYICDNGRLSETIRLLYRTKLLARSKRVKHYANYFFLFSDSLDGGGRDFSRMVNANAQTISLVDWCTRLRSTKWTKRRDEEFQQMGAVPFDNSPGLSTAL